MTLFLKIEEDPSSRYSSACITDVNIEHIWYIIFKEKPIISCVTMHYLGVTGKGVCVCARAKQRQIALR